MTLPGTPQKQGLFDPAREYDSCGVGFVVHLKGQRSHKIIDDALTALENLLEQAAADRSVGVIVLTGAGERAFCVGGDVNWEKGNEGKSGLEDAAQEFQLNRKIVECLKPVIARVNGYAIGGGNHIAYFCDITIAAEHATFGQNGPRVGSPAGAGVAERSIEPKAAQLTHELLCDGQSPHDFGIVVARRQRSCEPHVADRGRRRDVDHRAIGRQRAVEIAERPQRHGKRRVRCGILRVELDGATRCAHGRFGIVAHEIDHRRVVKGHGVARVALERSIDRSSSFGEPPPTHV